ncbi:MAG TPA: ABC-2 family transporter protein [Phycisphaerae bacterium]|nr:ABC-2 family transporter protein [Phycisphaerae bacterium]
MSVQNFAAYRFDFFVRLFVSLGHLFGELLAVATVFSNTESLAGWRVEHMLVLVGVFRIVAGGIRMFIVPNMRKVMEDIRSGSFDFLLLAPLDAQFHVSVREFVVWRITDVVLGAALALYGCHKLLGTIPLPQVVLFVFMMIASFTIVYAVWLTLAAVCFWIVRIENIEMIFWNIFEAGRFPIQIYPPWMQWGLTYLIPVAFITTFPAASLLGDPVTGMSPRVPLFASILALAALLLSSWIFRRGLRRYSGASA